MRKLLKIFVIGIAGFVVIVVGLFGFAMIRGSALDSESKAYVEKAVVAITSHWSAAELERRAAPKLLATTSPARIEAIFDNLSALGDLEKYEGAEGQATIFSSVRGGSKATARYLAKARYAHGEATIEILIEKMGGAWKILAFHVNSPALASYRGRQHI